MVLEIGYTPRDLNFLLLPDFTLRIIFIVFYLGYRLYMSHIVCERYYNFCLEDRNFFVMCSSDYRFIYFLIIVLRSLRIDRTCIINLISERDDNNNKIRTLKENN